MNIKNYLWLLPFLSFIAGYISIQWFFHVKELQTPSLVGKHVNEVLPILTHHNLNIRLIHEKQEGDLPEGIILYQTPSAGTTIKPHQHIFVVTTKKPLPARAPHCIGLSLSDITKQCEQLNIKPRIYYLSHEYPRDRCFAQSPQKDEPLEKNRLTLFISSGNNKPIIWPDFKGKSLQEVIEFLTPHEIEPYIIYNTSTTQKDEYYVIDQRPLAGTLLTLDENRSLSVQLRVT